MDRSYKALADPTRRRILELLREKDLAAGDIAAEFPVAWASISHHLSVLKEAGLVVATRNGQSIMYSLNETVFQELVRHLMGITAKKRRTGHA